MIKKKTRKRLTVEKRVHFSSERPSVRLCPRIEEPIWYNETDFAAFERDNRKTVLLLTKHKLSELDPNQFCIDGLEFQISKSILRNHRFRKVLIRRTILTQQYLQKCNGNQNSERLKAVSQLFSKSASRRAQLKAAIFHALESLEPSYLSV